MTVQASAQVGKAKLTVDVEGCYYCGTEWAGGWAICKTIDMRIGLRTYPVVIYACADCLKGHPVQETLL